MSRLSASLILFLMVPCLGGAQASRPGAGDYPGFDLRYGMPEGADLKALIEDPTLISMTAEKFKDPVAGEWRLVGYGDAHGVFDVPFEAVLALLDDPTKALSYSPRLLEARIEERKGPRVVTYQRVGIAFLGFVVGSRLRAEQLRDDLTPGEVGYRVRLLESLDGNFFESFSSYYVKKVAIEGRALVYLRTYTRSGLRRPALGTDLILKAFISAELKSTLDRVAKAARRLAAGK